MLIEDLGVFQVAHVGGLGNDVHFGVLDAFMEGFCGGGGSDGVLIADQDQVGTLI